MDLIKDQYEFIRFGIEYNLRRAGIDIRDERGVVSTETAVLIAGVVAIAVAVGAILMAKAQSNANNIPDTVQGP